MRNLLNAFVGALLGDAVPRWIDVSGRIRQSVGPPDGGRIEDHVVFGPVVKSRTVLAHIPSVDGGIASCDNAHTGQIHGRGPVPLPTNKTFD